MEEGDIIHVDYDLYNGETGDLIETTREATAQEHEMHDENRTYQPMVCVVGSGSLIPGFEEALLEAKVDKDVDLELLLLTHTAKKIQPKSKPSASTNYEELFVIQMHSISALLSTSAVAKATSRSSLGLVVHVSITTIQWLERPSSTTSRSSRSLKERKRRLLHCSNQTLVTPTSVLPFDGDDLNIVIPQTMLFDTNAAMMKFRLVTFFVTLLSAGVSFIEEHEPRVIAEEEE